MAGFFKKLGASAKSLSKMIAIKNVTKAVSGQYGDLAMEAASRTVKPFMAGGGVPNSPKNVVANAAIAGVTTFGRTVAGQTSANEELGKFGADIAESTVKEWLKRNWWMIVAFIGGVYVIFKTNLFGKKTTSKARRKW